VIQACLEVTGLRTPEAQHREVLEAASAPVHVDEYKDCTRSIRGYTWQAHDAANPSIVTMAHDAANLNIIITAQDAANLSLP
jgi:hypothetical protein